MPSTTFFTCIRVRPRKRSPASGFPMSLTTLFSTRFITLMPKGVGKRRSFPLCEKVVEFQRPMFGVEGSGFRVAMVKHAASCRGVCPYPSSLELRIQGSCMCLYPFSLGLKIQGLGVCPYPFRLGVGIRGLGSRLWSDLVEHKIGECSVWVEVMN